MSELTGTFQHFFLFFFGQKLQIYTFLSPNVVAENYAFFRKTFWTKKEKPESLSPFLVYGRGYGMFLNFYILLKLFSVPVGMNLEFSLIKTTGLCTGDASLSKTQKPSVDAAQYCQTLEIRIEPKGMV